MVTLLINLTMIYGCQQLEDGGRQKGVVSIEPDILYLEYKVKVVDQQDEHCHA